jgi:hypothetical protein
MPAIREWTRRDPLARLPSPGSASANGLGDRLAIGPEDRILVGRVAVAGDQVHQPAIGPTLEVLDHRNDALGGPLAGHHADDQPTLGVDGHVVPGVALAIIGRVGRVAVLLLLGDEGPLLVELDLTRPGGESATSSS